MEWWDDVKNKKIVIKKKENFEAYFSLIGLFKFKTNLFILRLIMPLKTPEFIKNVRHINVIMCI
jgi:hypothetical protein